MALSLSGCTGLFFHPDKNLRLTPSALGVAYEEVAIAGPVGLLHAWWLPSRDGESEARGTLVYAHGNAGNMLSHVEAVSWLPAQGYNVLIFDYRGFGYSEGEPDPRGVARDTLRAIEWTRARLGSMEGESEARDLVVYGHSLGAAASSVAAAHAVNSGGGYHRIRAVILDSGFSSYRSVAREKVGSHWMTAWLSPLVPLLFSDAVPPLEAVPELAGVPVYILHAEDDPIVPWSQGRRLFEAAGEPRYFYALEAQNHNHSWQSEADREWLLQTLEEVFAPAEGGR
ncbi:MAG: alpha/beta hydrolase [Pseudomonadota bacterium]